MCKWNALSLYIVLKHRPAVGIKVLGASDTSRVIFSLDTYTAGVNAMKKSTGKTALLNLCKSIINYFDYSQVLING